MKTRKKFLSLTLAVLLIIATAIPASAATVYREGSFGAGTFASSNNCYARNWNCTLEITSCSGNIANYLLCIDVVPYRLNSDGSVDELPTAWGYETTTIVNNYKNTTYNLDHIYFQSDINGYTMVYGNVRAN